MSDPLSITASLIAVLQLSSQVITYLKGVRDGSSDRARLRDELRNAIYLLEMLQDRAEEATEEDLQNGPLSTLLGLDGPLRSYHHTLEELVAKLAPRDSSQRRLQSLKWPFEKKEVERMLTSLDRQKTHFNLIIQHNVVGLTKITHQKLNLLGDAVSGLQVSQGRVEEHILSSEKQRILQWLSPLVFESRQADIFQRLQAGTGEWLLNDERFQKWCNSVDSGSVWCPGIPGAGKTFVAATVIHYLQQKFQPTEVAISFIYCDFQARAEQTILNLISSILRQVLDSQKSLPQDVISLYEDHKYDQALSLLPQYISLLRDLTTRYRSFFVVLDALDELLEADRAGLLSALRMVNPNICLLCTSRPLADIARLFEDSTKIEISAHDEDVRLFLESQITKASRLYAHVKADPSLKAEIVNTIAIKVEGMFLLATLHMESLASKLSRKDVRKQLQRLPQTLDGTYAQSLARIRSQSEDDVRLAERVLSWIVCSERPLSVRELQQMYATWSLESEENSLDDDALPDGDSLSSVCGGLVVIDAQLHTVRLVHYTAQDYFERNHMSMLEVARWEMTKLCLRYICLENFTEGVCDNDLRMNQRLQDYPFLEYASRYWSNFIYLINVDEHWEHFRSFFEDKNALQVATQAGSLPTYRFTGWSQRYPRDIPPLVHAASFGGTKSLLLRLLDIFPDLEDKGSDGQTALIRSAVYGHLSNVIVLREAGARVDAVDSGLQTALMHAVDNDHSAIVEFLITQDGSSPSHKDQDGWTALMAGASNGNLEVIKTLVQAGAEVNTESLDGDTALSLAVKGRFQDVFDFLVLSQARLPVNSASRRAMRVATAQGFIVSTNEHDLWQTDTASTAVDHTDNLPRLSSGFPAEISETDRSDNWFGSDDLLPTSHDLDGSDHVDRLQEFMTEYHTAPSFRLRYQKKELLGSTHTAKVHSCSDRVTGALYVVKIYDVLESNSEYPVNTKLDLIGHEVRLLNNLHHSNVLGIHDLIAEIEYIYIVYNVAQSDDLFNYIVRETKVSEQGTRKIYRQLCSAIQYLHECHIMHRDIKAENVLVIDHNLSILVVNFQRATVVSSDGFEVLLTGTPLYVAPEMLEYPDNRRYSLPIDVWSMGVLLYICLCGFPPFSDELYTAENPYTMAQQIKTGRFDYPSPYWDPIPDSALDLIDRMLTVDPSRRCTAQECLEHEWMIHEDGAGIVPQRGSVDPSPSS